MCGVVVFVFGISGSYFFDFGDWGCGSSCGDG